MKKLKENWLPILLISVCILWLWVTFVTQKAVTSNTNFYKSKLGSKIVLSKDTLTIVDYNSFTEVFILSNKQEVNKNLVK